MLLGAPGAGKSAVLARLGNALRERGVALLALKADALPRGTASLEALDEWMGAGVPVARALERLAEDGPAVLLVNQLDALADLMDQYGERMDALLQLMHRVRRVPDLSVVLSCREFEFRNDARLATLDATLVTPPWDSIVPLLAAKGIDPSGWGEDFREVLRTPQHLALFLEQSSSPRFRGTSVRQIPGPP